MVDGSASLQVPREEGWLDAEPVPASTHDLNAAVESCSPDALSRYADMITRGTAGHSQQALWVTCWMESVPTDGFILTVFKGERPVMALPLEVVQSGSVRTARFMGGSHANANFPAFVPGSGPLEAEVLRRTLVSALAVARPDIDALVLERQMHVVGEVANPLAALPHQTSPNIALAVGLANGFEGVLAKHNGKKRRKKHRYQCRKFEEAGGYRYIRAQSPEEADRLFTAYVGMKASWFRRNGLPDVFAGEEIGRFFRALFGRALQEEEPKYYMEAVEVSGVLRAVSGSSRVAGRVVCEFGGIAEDDMTQFSPGEYLTFESIQAACNDGNVVYDYGVGDEHYKRHWCDEEIHHFDVVLPLTAKGRLYAGVRKPFTALKRRVKSSPAMARMVRRLRGRHGRDNE